MLNLGYRLTSTEHGHNGIGFCLKPDRRPSPSEIIEDAGEAHLLTLAPTGAGKGRSNLIPACLQYPGSLIVIDPKGEAATVTAKTRKRYGPVFIVDPFRIVSSAPDKFNPFDIVLPGSSPEQYGIMLSEAFQADAASISDDRFWDNKATELLSGLCIHELTKGRSFRSLRKHLYCDDVDYNLAVMMDNKELSNTLAYELIAAYLQIPSERTRPSVLCTAQQHLAILGEPAVLDSLDGPTSFDVQGLLRGEPISVYLVIPPNKLKAFSPLLRLWVVSFLYLLTERKKRPSVPTLMLIDEAGSLGRIDALISSVTLLRSFGVRIWTFYQDLGFMKRLYPLEWTTILHNCDVVQAFGVRNYLMAKEIAEVFGGFSPQQLLQMPPDQALLARPGRPVERIRRFDYLNDKIFKKYGFEPNGMYGKAK